MHQIIARAMVINVWLELRHTIHAWDDLRKQAINVLFFPCASDDRKSTPVHAIWPCLAVQAMC